VSEMQLSEPKNQQISETFAALGKRFVSQLGWLSLGIAIIAGAGIIAHLNVSTVPLYEQEQNLIQQIANPKSADSQTNQGEIVKLSFWLNRAIAGADTGGFRTFNLALHILTSIMVYLFCRKLFGNRIPEPVAVAGGLLFALHPVTSETIVYLPAREYLLATLFGILALYGYLCATQNEEKPSIVFLSISLCSFLLSWSASAALLVFPALVFAADWVTNAPETWEKRFYRFQAPYWIMALMALTVFFATNGFRVAGTTVSVSQLVLAFPHYLTLAIQGTGLSLVHPQPTSENVANPAFLSAAGVFGIFIFLALVLLKRRSALGFALILFLATLLSFMITGESSSVLTERKLYLPLVGAVLVLPWLFTLPLVQKGIVQKAASLGAILLLVAAGVGSFARISQWNDPLGMWTESAQKAPDSAYVQEQIGSLILQQANAKMASLLQNASRLDAATRNIHMEQIKELYGKAEKYLRNADDLRPQNAHTLLLLGNSLEGQGKADEAIETLYKALLLDLSRQEAALQLGTAYQQKATQENSQADLMHALEYYRYAESLGTLPLLARSNYARVLVAFGEFEKAYALLAASIAEMEQQGVPSQNIDVIRMQADQLRQTVEYLKKMEQQLTQVKQGRSARDPEVLMREAELHAARKKILHVAYLMDMYLAQRPNDVNAWIMGGLAKGIMGAADGFLNEWPAPQQQEGDKPSVYIQLAQVCAANGKWDLAETYLSSPQAAPEIPSPLITLGDIAVQLTQTARAKDYFKQASEKNPDAALPWLKLCDVALTEKDFTTARGYLAEAEKRQATQEELSSRKKIIEEASQHTDTQSPITVLR